MLGFYIFSAIVGGILVLVNVFVGGHGHDFEGGHDFDHGGADHDSDHGDADHGLWLPFLSLRFWTYFFAATGAVGLLLTKLSGSGEPTTGIIALATGLVCGLSVAIAVRYLSRYDSDSAAKMDDLLGMEAKVLVTVRQDSPGKIRCHLKGDTIDLLALAQDDAILEVGSDAIIVAIEDDRARVVPREVLYG
jgi:hypothetical protein